MSKRVSFLAAELEYGCHSRQFEIPEVTRPVVIVGPNGAGKTTLIEGLIRVLFGFSRRNPGERDRLTLRTPWHHDKCRGRVEILGGDERRWQIERDLVSGETSVTGLDSAETWSGDANPAASNQEATEYRRLLGRIFGIAEMAHYESTAYVVQGSLIGTQLEDDLLQIAGGGYGNVDEALGRLVNEHRSLTLEPIASDGSKGRKAQELERIEAEIGVVDSRLQEATAAFNRRRPIQRELDRCGRRISNLESEIHSLERALGPLNEQTTIEARIASLNARLESVERVQSRLEGSATELRQADRDGSRWRRESYPDDFLERTGRIEAIWPRLGELRAERSTLQVELGATAEPSLWTGLLTAAVLVIAGLSLWAWTSATAVSVSVALLGIGVGAGLEGRRRAVNRARKDIALREQRVERETEELTADLDRALTGVPNAADLTPSTISARKRDFLVLREKMVLVERVLRTLASEVHHAEQTLSREPEITDAAIDTKEESGAVTSQALLERARSLLSACKTERKRLLRDRAKEDLRLEQLVAVDLPEGVEATPRAAQDALDQRRLESRELRQEVKRLENRLLQEGSSHESIVALNDHLEVLAVRKQAIAREVQTLGLAYELLQLAYEQFREGDQSRLLGLVSAALLDLTSGIVGPLEPSPTLAETQVRLRGQVVDLRSPPLSYGEFHAALFSIRLGASDFLARSGIRPPLIIDEPFAYLDPGRAHRLWELLCRVAKERQVIIATQETLILEAVQIAPDIELERGSKADFQPRKR